MRYPARHRGFYELFVSRDLKKHTHSPYVIDNLKASTACPYFLFSGQPMRSYRSSIGCWVFSATCRMMEWTILPLLYLSSHLMISSGETLRFERSIYPIFPRISIYSLSTLDSGVKTPPFSLSTLKTTTTSFRPTRMSFWILLIRLLDNSESKIMPSMLSYSRSLT